MRGRSADEDFKRAWLEFAENLAIKKISLQTILW